MHCKVMGIVNVTPDSFSDGGKFNTPGEAIRRATNLVGEGAEIVDVGGESTRPGATPLPWEEEWARIEPVLRGLSPLASRPSGLPAFQLSVDTYHPETAERAVRLGATMVNCVYPEPIPAMLEIIAANPGVELVMPADSFPPDSSLYSPTLASRIYLDPMIGFGTTREEDLALLKAIPGLAKRGRVLVGASRKRIVKRLTGEKVTGKNLGGNLGIAVWAALRGASAVRVHDVKETVQALKVVETLGS